MLRNNIVIAVAFLATACSSNNEKAASAEATAADKVQLTDAQLKNAGIVTGTALKEVINAELKVNGLVEVPPQNIVSVSFPMGGYLRSTHLLPGMHVKKGQSIALVEDQALVQLQQDYLMAKTKLAYLEQDYKRQQSLHENNVNADKVFQQAESDYLSQKILLKGLGEKLSLIGIQPELLTPAGISRSVSIHSPINGFVSKVNVNIGKYVTATDVLFELINPDDMHAALTVFEKDLTKVNIGQQVNVSFVDDPATEYPCEVILVTRNVDENRSALVHCHFETMPKKLVPGMFLSARIQISNAEVFTVPEDAVVRFENKQYVFEATGKNEFRMVEVETGESTGGKLAISSTKTDLSALKLVTANAYAILSKMKNTAEE